MNTIDELAMRGTTRVQHDSWSEGEYMKLRIVNRDSGAPRVAPNALHFAKERAPQEVPVYTLAGNGEPEWRVYQGARDKADTGE